MTKEYVQARLLEFGGSVGAAEHFPTLEDQGWEFAAAPRWVDVVVTPDGEAFAGRPDEDGIVWLAGVGMVVKGGNERVAREHSLRWTPGCRAARVWAVKFRTVRGFGQNALLLVEGVEETAEAAAAWKR